MKYTPFLKSIAQHFYTKHRDKLRHYRFYFQNRRAGLFFHHYLKECAKADGQTIILPQVTTLIEQLRRKSQLPEADVNNDLLVIYELYLALNQLDTESGWSSFSDFYQLGEYIINDFGDLDKHLKDPEEVYENAALLAEISDDKDYINEQQNEALRQLMKEDPKRHRHTFQSLFRKMPLLYSRLRQRLQRAGLAYDGMVLRNIYEQIRDEKQSLIGDGFTNVFVGLNVLSEVERLLLKHYQEDPSTLFYWDYEGPAMQDGRIAGTFRAKNLRDFPMPKDEDHIDFDPISDLPDVELVSIPSKVAQAVYIGDNCLKTKSEEWKEKVENLEVAIVLPNERLLMPLLSNLPANLGYEVNVTMGYPLREMPLVGMLLRLVAIQKQVRLRGNGAGEAYWRGVEVKEILASTSLDVFFKDTNLRTTITGKIDKDKLFRLTAQGMQELWAALKLTPDQCAFLEHLFAFPDPHDATSTGGLALMSYFITLVEQIMDAPADPDEDEEVIYTAERSVLPYLRDLLRERYEAIRSYIEQSPTSSAFSAPIVEDLLRALLTYARIPYRGEPLKGLQVMGLLETRGLDFDILLIPDATEGVLPGRSHLKSIIPHVIRRALQLPTYEWHEQTRAYNFLRLASRASQLYCTYDSRRNYLSDGEPSRYFRLIEYLYDTTHQKVIHKSAGYPLRTHPEAPASISPDPQKWKDYRSSLVNGESKSKSHLSASAINDYLSCPLKFYAKRVEGIQDIEDPSETIDSRILGTIVHATLQDLYQRFVGKLLDKQQLRQWLSEDDYTMDQVIRECYTRELNRQQMGSYDELFFPMIHTMVKNVIRHDLESPGTIKYVDGEVEFHAQVPVGTGERVNVKGFIDRMHISGDELHIVDFKTGGDEANTSINPVVVRSNDKNNKAGTQLLLYTLLLSDEARYRTRFEKNVSIDPVHAIVPYIYKPLTDQYFTLRLSRAEGGRDHKPLENFADWSNDVQILLEGVVAEIVSSDQTFPPNPSTNACRYCPIAQLCPDAILI